MLRIRKIGFDDDDDIFVRIDLHPRVVDVQAESGYRTGGVIDRHHISGNETIPDNCSIEGISFL
jgi:hypothetical protein